MRTGDKEHLKRVAKLEAILGCIDLPNYPELSAFETERHGTSGGIVSATDFYRDCVYEAIRISKQTTYRMLDGLKQIR